MEPGRGFLVRSLELHAERGGPLKRDVEMGAKAVLDDDQVLDGRSQVTPRGRVEERPRANGEVRELPYRPSSFVVVSASIGTVHFADAGGPALARSMKLSSLAQRTSALGTGLPSSSVIRPRMARKRSRWNSSSGSLWHSS